MAGTDLPIQPKTGDFDTYAVHNLCAQRYTALGGVNLSVLNTAIVQGADVYQKLVEYIKDYLQKLFQEAEKHTGRALLDFCVKAGKRYKAGASYISNVFQFLNRHWINHQREGGRTDIWDVETLYMVLWHNELLPGKRPGISAQLKTALVEIMDDVRDGKAVGEYGQIKEIIEFFQSFTFAKSFLDTCPHAVHFYMNHVEEPILEATQKYYEAKSKTIMASSTHHTMVYIHKITACLKKEVRYGRMFFPESIASRLQECCCTALVEGYFDVLLDDFQVSLNYSHVRGLARLCKLLTPIPGGVESLTEKFRHHIAKEGLDAVASGMETLGPQLYVGELVRIYSLYKGLVDQEFGDTEPGFTEALNNACRDFVNAGSSGRGTDSKAPELLAKYADSLLRKNIEERELESSLEAVTSTLVFMDDKDVFQRHYSRLLAKRLLIHNNLMASEGEHAMVDKLQEVYGLDYGNRLRLILRDMQLSKDINAEFQGLGNTTDSYTVLSTSIWPLHLAATAFKPPVQVSAGCDRFSQFYKAKQEFRKLTWLWQLCKGELTPTYCKRRYIFHVSLYQMAVLLLFNESGYNTYEEIQTATELEPHVLDPTLSILYNKSKVLLMSPKECKTAGPGTVFRLNHDVKFGKIKVILNLQSTKEDKVEKGKINKAVEMDRDLSMQAAIVRIMKARKKMKYTQLLSETISQVSAHFKPEVADIKKCIESLLNREYLQRLEDDEIEYFSSEPAEKTPASMAPVPMDLLENMSTFGLS